MKQSISLVTIAVVDFDVELSFYKNTLGWTPFTEVEKTIAFFNVGGFVFSICAKEELVKDVGYELKTEAYKGFTIAQNLPSIKAVDDVFKSISSSNGTMVKNPAKTDWGGYSGYFSDPEGNLWEIAYNPQFEYNEQGTMIVPN